MSSLTNMSQERALIGKTIKILNNPGSPAAKYSRVKTENKIYKVISHPEGRSYPLYEDVVTLESYPLYTPIEYEEVKETATIVCGCSRDEQANVGVMFKLTSYENPTASSDLDDRDIPKKELLGRIYKIISPEEAGSHSCRLRDVETGEQICFFFSYEGEVVEEKPNVESNIKSKVMKIDQKEVYAKLHAAWVEAVGLKKGMKVKVTRVAESHEQGWDNSWVPEMKAGNVLTVIDAGDSAGVMLNDGKSYPYFVLEVVEDESTIITIESSDFEIKHPERELKIHADKSLEMGCKHFTPGQSKKLITAFKSAVDVLNQKDLILEVYIGGYVYLSATELDEVIDAYKKMK